MQEQLFDAVERPSHYIFSNPCFEVKDVINDRLSAAIREEFNWNCLYEYTNAMKYILRAPLKDNPIEDFKKARKCINDILELLDRDTSD